MQTQAEEARGRGAEDVQRAGQRSVVRVAPWWDAPLCAIVVLLCFLAARPYVEMGLVDDFSYVKTAWVFAHTGRLVYNGWATAMLGWQIPFAAPFIRVLGDTFFAARVSITVLLLASVLVIHAVLLRGGLNRERAAFGTLLVGLSPLTLPMAATFMTDVAGMLVIMLCLYCAQRALTALSDSAVLGWLLLGFVIGAVGGTARQIAWMAALMLMPSAAWMLRRRRGVVVLAVAMWVVSLAVMLGSLHWFNQQPFHVPEPLKQGPLVMKWPRELLGTMLAAALCLALLVLPIMVEALHPARRWKPKIWAGLLAGAAVGTLVARFLTFHIAERGLLPWTGDIVGRMDIFDSPNLWLLGVTPITWNMTARWIGSYVVVLVLLIFAYALRTWRANPAGDAVVARGFTWRELAILLGPFCAAYIALLSPRGIWAMILDRYLLPLLVIAALLLLRLCQERLSARLRTLPWALLVVFTLWTIAGLHDWIESHRARIAAVERIEAAGVPRWKVNAGYEYDGLTQIDMQGAVVDPRVTYPAGFDTALHLPADLPVECKPLFQTHTPALRPEYFLSYDPEPCLAPSQFGDMTYRRWLPPFVGRIHILKLEYGQAAK